MKPEISAALEKMRTYPDGSYLRCPFCGCKSSEHKPECPIEVVADEVTRLKTLINTPELADFDKGVPLECAHQIERWGQAHDRSKSAENWYWLVGYLAGKALRASIKGEREKALHHTISSAAALRNWHRAIQQDTTGAGIGQDADLEAIEAPLAEFKR